MSPKAIATRAHAQVARFEDLHEACIAVVTESYRLWLEHETRTDDISMIIIQVRTCVRVCVCAACNKSACCL